MNFDPSDSDPQPEPRLLTRRTQDDPHHPHTIAAGLPPSSPRPAKKRRRPLRAVVITLVTLLLLVIIAWFAAQTWVRHTTRAALPQLDGTQQVPGLAAPVTVARDAHGVPHIQATTTDDLVFAQAYITTQDRLFQMDLLRRHAAGELAEILGPSLLDHDKLQRTLQIRAAADRAVAVLPITQLHLLEVYARGVNASIARQHPHLPLEFHLLGYEPRPWTPRDSLLVSLAMFQDLTNAYPGKLARESLATKIPPALLADMYPIGSWRDHPPTTPEPDLTIQGPPIEQVPLDETQSRNRRQNLVGAPGRLAASSRLTWDSSLQPPASPQTCDSCTPGSNNWVVSAQHTASGHPILANDMHLTHTLPGIWYEADLQSPNLHVAGVSIPGLPLIVVGHNDHVAWGFTNLGADVQDVYIETLRGKPGNEEFQAPDGTWQPVQYLPEPIKIKHYLNQTLIVRATRHGDTLTPILSPTLKNEARPLALRWTLYDPTVVQLPVLELAQAADAPALVAAFSHFGGPAQNVVYADDQGHIGYHAAGRIPLRGPAIAPTAPIPTDLANPAPEQDPNQSPGIHTTNTTTPLQIPETKAQQLAGPLSPVPLIPSPAHEWSGYIPYDQLPQVADPRGGVIATANSRIVPDDYPYPITLNWAAPYRNERIWHVLAGSTALKPSDMLAIQTDVYSDFDHVLAQRLAYAIDHTADPSPRLKQAADLLRNWNGRMTVDSSAAAIVSAVHAALWPALLRSPALAAQYTWGEKDYALEQILMHTPARWLPPTSKSWDDFLAATVDQTLKNDPRNLTALRYGPQHTVEFDHPVLASSPILRRLLGVPTGTGPQPQPGDATTIRQVGHTFGPSERFTTSPGDWDTTTLNIVSGQSGNPFSPWFLDQFPAWLRGTTFPFPFTQPYPTHTLTLTPR